MVVCECAYVWCANVCVCVFVCYRPDSCGSNNAVSISRPASSKADPLPLRMKPLSSHCPAPLTPLPCHSTTFFCSGALSTAWLRSCFALNCRGRSCHQPQASPSICQGPAGVSWFPSSPSQSVLLHGSSVVCSTRSWGIQIWTLNV